MPHHTWAVLQRLGRISRPSPSSVFRLGRVSMPSVSSVVRLGASRLPIGVSYRSVLPERPTGASALPWSLLPQSPL